jgi:hypothetical protein
MHDESERTFHFVDVDVDVHVHDSHTRGYAETRALSVSRGS